MNSGIEESLTNLPDQVGDALEKWRRATLEREKKEALLYLEFKGSAEKRTADEVKAMVRSNEDRYKFCLYELKKEADYTRLYERLLSLKRLANMREAY